MLRASAVLAIIAGLTTPMAAEAAGKAKSPCPKRANELYAVNSGWVRVWHDRSSVYACSQSSARWNPAKKRWVHKFSTKRLGPWAAGSVFDYDYVTDTAIWLRPQAVGSGRAKRLWATHISGAPVLRRLAARPGVGGPLADGDFDTVKFGPSVVAWTSGDSAFMIALGTYPVEFGEGFPAPPASSGRIIGLGTWPGAAQALAASLRIEEKSGEADECGGGGAYVVSVAPAGTPLTATSGYYYDGKCYGL